MWMTLLIYIGILILLALLAYLFIYVAPIVIIILAILLFLELLGYSLFEWLGIELPKIWALESLLYLFFSVSNMIRMISL